MSFLIIKSKRGMDAMAFILIALILAALVLISLSGGLKMVIGKLKFALGGSSNIDYIKGFCDLSCNLGFNNDYCYKPRTLVDNEGNKLKDVTCNFLAFFKQKYEINPCIKILCSVEINTSINSQEQFKNAQCTKNKLYLQSFIKTSEKEYVLLSKECSNEINLIDNEGKTSNNEEDLKKYIINLGIDANNPKDKASFEKFCNSKQDIKYKGVSYKDVSFYALSQENSADFICSSSNSANFCIPTNVIYACENEYKIKFLNSNYLNNLKESSRIQNAYSNYIQCLEKSEGKNCVYPLASETYSLCKNFQSFTIQFFYDNEDNSKTLITLPFKCGDYKNIDDSCLGLYKELITSGYLQEGFCDKRMNLLDNYTGILYIDATCFSVLYNTISKSYDSQVMSKCYPYQYLISEEKDNTAYKKLKSFFSIPNYQTKDLQINCNELYYYPNLKTKPNSFQILLPSNQETNSYKLFQFNYYCP
jgi:hypothetical protein